MDDYGYLCLRSDKLTRPEQIAQSVGHALREIPTPNADPARKHLNIMRGPKTVAEFKDKLKDRLSRLRIPRKDSPRLLEYFIGASPEFFDKGGDYRKFFNNAYQFLIERHGAENIVLCGVHNDELTPHMTAFVVPVKPGTNELSAKHFQGSAVLMRKLQDVGWEAIGKPVGLRRGEQGSKARHVPVNRWKAAMAVDIKPQSLLELPKPSLKDRADPAAWVAPLIADAKAKLEAAAVQIAAARRVQEETKTEMRRLRARELGFDMREIALSDREKNLRSRIEENALAIARAAVSQIRPELDELVGQGKVDQAKQRVEAQVRKVAETYDFQHYDEDPAAMRPR